MSGSLTPACRQGPQSRLKHPCSCRCCDKGRFRDAFVPALHPPALILAHSAPPRSRDSPRLAHHKNESGTLLSVGNSRRRMDTPPAWRSYTRLGGPLSPPVNRLQSPRPTHRVNFTMSLGRLVYYSAVLAGWAALIAWIVAEWVILGRLPLEVLLTAAVVGGAIGCAVNVAAGMSGTGLQTLLKRAAPGFVGGAIGGAVGGLVGDVAYGIGLPRGLGWMLMGVGIGMVEGIQERSFEKVRNGLIGGAIGGLIGGFLFDPVQALAASGSGMSSRATAFVVLGLSIGACIGLAHVVLKEAWLTVLDGYRPGRQLILSRSVTTLGRADHLPLPFLGTMNADLSPEQVRIARQPDGHFFIEDIGGTQRSWLNQVPIHQPVGLRDNDVIKVGRNLIRFNERRATHPSQSTLGTASPRQTPAPPPPPVPVPPPPPVPTRSSGVTAFPLRHGDAPNGGSGAGAKPVTPPPSAPPPPAPPHRGPTISNSSPASRPPSPPPPRR